MRKKLLVSLVGTGLLCFSMAASSANMAGPYYCGNSDEYNSSGHKIHNAAEGSRATNGGVDAIYFYKGKEKNEKDYSCSSLAANGNLKLVDWGDKEGTGAQYNMNDEDVIVVCVVNTVTATDIDGTVVTKTTYPYKCTINVKWSGSELEFKTARVY